MPISNILKMNLAKHIARVAAVSITILFAQCAHTLDINKTGSRGLWQLTGEIAKGDLDRFVDLVEDSGSLPDEVLITSEGGDVTEAIALGELFRTALITTTAVRTCNSACFLLWAGGVERKHVGTTFGLHRPYFDASYFSELTPAEAAEKYDELERTVRSYLMKASIPTSVIDKMMSTSSQDGHFLPGDEAVRAVGNLPGHEEWIIAKCGGLDKKERAEIGRAHV